ncbi:Serine/threonine-protein kinase HT1 [Leucoagaricus sp. SymC.cos]|nr:Serine/threonine-protein kinase HT1 [Leucoagaricus sp. SymC.cos]
MGKAVGDSTKSSNTDFSSPRLTPIRRVNLDEGARPLYRQSQSEDARGTGLFSPPSPLDYQHSRSSGPFLPPSDLTTSYLNPDQSLYGTNARSLDGPLPSFNSRSVSLGRALLSTGHIRRASSETCAGRLSNNTGTSAYPTSRQPSSGLSPIPDAFFPKPIVTTGRTASIVHKRRKQEATFVCPIPGCGSTFTRSFNLKGHIRSHKEEKPPSTCDGCGKQFARMDALDRHLRSEGGADCLKLQQGASGEQGHRRKSENAEEVSRKGELYKSSPGYLSSHAQTHLCSLVVRISTNKDLQTRFKTFFSEKSRRVEAQLLSDYLSALLYEGTFPTSSDQTKVLRLLCRLAALAQVYPNRFLLTDVQLSTDPVQVDGVIDTYEGKHELGKVRVKVLRVIERESQALLLKAFTPEIILWAHMSHENILPFYGVYSFGASMQRICLVSPMMKNGDLQVFLQKNPTTPRLSLIQDVIQGLVYLHHSEIVHGDLKAVPLKTNVLVSDDGRALIADFGLSYIPLTTLVGSTEVNPVHTMNWSAPELVLDDAPTKPTKESDIWSFGCLCYEAYTGKLPYYDCKGIAQVLRALMKGQLPKRPSQEESACDQLDDTIWNLLTQGCWNHQPEKRYTCDEVRDALVSIVSLKERSDVSCWEEQKLAFWTAMRDKSGSYVDYDQVGVILENFLKSHEAATVSPGAGNGATLETSKAYPVPG